jgi:hypothetical protein
MGLDYRYRAIPRDCPLLELACARRDFGEYLDLFGFRPPDQETIAQYSDKPEFSEFHLETARARTTNPGIENRMVDIGRHWDMLYYLLSDARRLGLAEDERDPAYKLILGGKVIDSNVRSMQGIPICYLNPEETQEVFRWLERQPDTILADRWDPRQMAAAGVYKMHPEDDEELLGFLQADLSRLTIFFVAAVANDKGILSICR